MTMPPAFAETMRALAAPDARRIRIDWFGAGSGARITHWEAELLYAYMTRAEGMLSPTQRQKINVPALIRELEQRTRRRHAEWKQRREAEKKAKKANRKRS